jgi:hypothetical protein
VRGWADENEAIYSMPFILELLRDLSAAGASPAIRCRTGKTAGEGIGGTQMQALSFSRFCSSQK